MDRLNYFNPYQSKEGHHEDQLTRAFLTLLKHSSHAFFIFIEYCRRSHVLVGKERAVSILDYLEQGWEIETQKGNPVIKTNYLLSVLITDEHINHDRGKIRTDERNARYDGVITFGSNLTIIIENKPRSKNVWFKQLNPSRQNLAEETIVYSKPVIIEWKSIIQQLNFALNIPTIEGAEKLLVENFLSFIDYNFPFLNPYTNLGQCKGRSELLLRRINTLLKSIALDEDTVKYHKGWGFYIETPFRQIQEIGLILNQNEKDWWLEISLYFGATQRQAISFYNSTPDISKIEDGNWKLHPNFHVSFSSTNLVWFPSKDSVEYLEYWKENVDRICQQKRGSVEKYLKNLVKRGIIMMPPEVSERLQQKFYNTAMQTLNICPEFGCIYRINSLDAEELDRSGQLKLLIAKRIKEALRIINLDCSELII